jgi:hypothetical protein
MLKTEMFENEESEEKLKVNDVVKLKNSKYAKIISVGDVVEDIDYGWMYKHIITADYITEEDYLRIRKEKEDKKVAEKKEKEEKDDCYMHFINYTREHISERLECGDFSQLDFWKNGNRILFVKKVVGSSSFCLYKNELYELSFVGYNTYAYKLDLDVKQLDLQIKKLQKHFESEVKNNEIIIKI